MSARKATGPKRPRQPPRDAAALALAMVRGFRTGDDAEVRRIAARAPADSGATVATMLAAVVAGLTAGVTDEQLEAAVTAAFLRGIQRRSQPGSTQG